MPKLSIITINFNNKEGLEKTIKSVINQTYTDYEYIIIDGGSTDGSFEVIKKFTNKITDWISESDKGIYNAMNKGILKAKGEYLLFLNSGDTLVNDQVLELASRNINSKYDIHYGNLILKDYSGNIKLWNPPKKLTFNFFVKNTLPHPSTFIKRQLFKKVFYYNEELKIVSDWEFFLCAICKFNTPYNYLDQKISVFDTTGVSSLKENQSLNLKERKLCLENHFPLFIDDYKTFFEMRELLSQNRFKMLKELENSIFGRKILYVLLIVFLKIFRGKSISELRS